MNWVEGLAGAAALAAVVYHFESINSEYTVTRVPDLEYRESHPMPKRLQACRPIW